MDHKICVNCKYAVDKSDTSIMKCRLTGRYCYKIGTCEYFDQNASKEIRSEISQRAELRAQMILMNAKLDNLERQLANYGTFMDVLLTKIVSIDKKIDGE